MAEVFHRGTPDPKQQRKTRRYNPDGGYIETSDWASFSEAQILALFNLAARQGLEVEMSSRYGRHELTIVNTRGETRIDRWEFGISDENPSLLQNPYLDVEYSGGVVAEEDRFVIGVALKKGITLDEAVSHPDVVAKYGVLPALSTGSANRVRRIHEMMANGQTQYQAGNLVLRHTTNVSNRYELNVSDENENCIYYHADFLAEVLNTSLWIFPMPGRLEYKATSFFNRHEPAAKDYYLWGWLKSISPETTVANQRVEIQTTYKLDFWPLDLYRIAS